MSIKPSYYLKLFRDSRYLLYINILEQFFFFLIFLVFARKFSVEKYGELITLFTLANVFITFLNLGLPVFLQKETAVSGESSTALINRVLSINVIVFFIYFLLTFSYYFLFYHNLSLKLFLVSIVPVYLYSNINILNAFLSGLQKYKKQFGSFINARVVTVILFLVIAFLPGTSLTLLVAVYSLGFLYQIVLLFFNIKKISGSCIVPFHFIGIGGILKVSFPLGMAVLFNYLYDKIDILLISKFTDFSQVGYYNIGYGIYKASSIAFSFLLISGLTRVSYLSRRVYAVKLFIKKYFSAFVLIGIAINIFLFFSSEYIVRFIYTDKFIVSSLILKIVSFAVLGLALNNLAGVVLNGLGLYRENMYVTFTGLMLNIILNFIFIPVFGIIAAAVISIFTEYFILAGDFYFLKKFLKTK